MEKIKSGYVSLKSVKISCWNCVQQEAGPSAARSAFWGHAKPASSGLPEEEGQEEEGQEEEEQNLDDFDDTASLASIALADVTRHGHDGEQCKVVPQPIIAPYMLWPG